MSMNHESNVRSYCRSFPDVFHKAKGSILYSVSGKSYIDFFAGAGSLNYGHNHPYIKSKIIDYIENDGVIQSLDMYTSTKEQFIEKMQKSILEKNNYQYKLQFCGPTGTNAIEAAVKLARKVTGRTNIFAFMGSFHGMSLGSLSLTSSHYHRNAAGVPLTNSFFFPFADNLLNIDSINYLEHILSDDHSGIEKPAAIIIETIQAEGGVNIASIEWLKSLQSLCSRHEILLICDEIQVGCGRTGEFFSFQESGIEPDIVVLSKSISGYGLPMAVLLIKGIYDIWKPGEHNGTFRGNQLSFIGATAALDLRESINLQKCVERKSNLVETIFINELKHLHEKIKFRGKGLIWGIDFIDIFPDSNKVIEIRNECFNDGLLIECAGRNSSVLKLLPPLTTEDNHLIEGCNILINAIKKVMNREKSFV